MLHPGAIVGSVPGITGSCIDLSVKRSRRQWLGAVFGDSSESASSAFGSYAPYQDRASISLERARQQPSAPW